MPEPLPANWLRPSMNSAAEPPNDREKGIMGTFHDTKDPLHGITVVAISGRSVHVGRCHERDDQNILLLGVDSHQEDESGRGVDGRTNQEFLERAARLGTWGTHERVVLPTAEVEGLIPLSDYYRSLGRTGGPSPLTAGSSDPAAGQSATSRAPDAIVSAAPAEDADKPVNLTESACSEVRKLLEEAENQGKGLRLGVAGGGCSGLVYKVEFDAEKEGDLVVPFDGFQVYLDRKSTIYLRGVTLDYSHGLVGRGFQFHNPNASNTCGCGESFAV